MLTSAAATTHTADASLHCTVPVHRLTAFSFIEAICSWRCTTRDLTLCSPYLLRLCQAGGDDTICTAYSACYRSPLASQSLQCHTYGLNLQSPEYRHGTHALSLLPIAALLHRCAASKRLLAERRSGGILSCMANEGSALRSCPAEGDVACLGQTQLKRFFASVLFSRSGCPSLS